MPSSCDKTAAVAESSLISLAAAIVYKSRRPGSCSVVFSGRLRSRCRLYIPPLPADWLRNPWRMKTDLKCLLSEVWKAGCTEIPGLKSPSYIKRCKNVQVFPFHNHADWNIFQKRVGRTRADRNRNQDPSVHTHSKSVQNYDMGGFCDIFGCMDPTRRAQTNPYTLCLLQNAGPRAGSCTFMHVHTAPATVQTSASCRQEDTGVRRRLEEVGVTICFD